ncbi:MAG: hypothetical protein QXR57_02790 [Metallosphaera sp.]|uniref:Uncharacterized protein n=1 Tax=Metallosphaera cuprina (strain Ar-4) TaxID=1006006 RepID=F4FZ69_METCR|nr:hypothetical protein [Metallosphaera cuprina]AEB94378.1 conserved hypothetical protein [Metallosphaera cuprina Ar-4]
MFKVIFRVTTEVRNTAGLREIKRAGFIPFMAKREGEEEVYEALYKSNDLEELREAITEAAYFLNKVNRKGGNNFATIYKVNDNYVGKGLGGLLGASLGLKLGGIPGLFIGAIGGLLLGEILDVELNETFVGVYSWPISIEQ